MRSARLALVAGALLTSSFSACGGSTPTAPSQTCQPVTGPGLAGSSFTDLRAGDILRVRFTVPSGLTHEFVLYTLLGNPNDVRNGALSHRLYDGTRLLGEQVRLNTGAAWKSRLNTTDNSPGALPVDFSTIVNGTIAGRVDLVVTSGQVNLETIELADGFFLGPGPDGLVMAPALTITSRELCR